ncbi:Uncharacterized protein HZ326_20642 [Fusarium oxysporum f. sp. albedinis]|nr:Uncharacterized protein HZ326_20642 [Fusarium oxysporum f. sp. albedinis]
MLFVSLGWGYLAISGLANEVLRSTAAAWSSGVQMWGSGDRQVCTQCGNLLKNDMWGFVYKRELLLERKVQVLNTVFSPSTTAQYKQHSIRGPNEDLSEGGRALIVRELDLPTWEVQNIDHGMGEQSGEAENLISLLWSATRPPKEEDILPEVIS